jgi:ribosome-associated heat shock protein Hsp15
MTAERDSIRIDQLLWRLRFAKSRGLAQKAIQSSHIRINGRRVLRASAAVRSGDVVTMPWSNSVLALKMLQIPHRRGPASEAQQCFELLEE